MNQQNDKFTDILKFVHTTEDRDLLTEELSKIINSLFNSSENALKMTLDQVVRKHVADTLITTWKTQNILVTDYTSVKTFLTELIDRLEKMTEVTFTLAFEPTQEILEVLYGWLVLNIPEKTLLSVSVDSRILAGVIITTNGKYKDYSYQKKFDETFNTTNQISEISAKIKVLASLSRSGQSANPR